MAQQTVRPAKASGWASSAATPSAGQSAFRTSAKSSHGFADRRFGIDDPISPGAGSPSCAAERRRAGAVGVVIGRRR
jgi:hypothetical protein